MHKKMYIFLRIIKNYFLSSSLSSLLNLSLQVSPTNATSIITYIIPNTFKRLIISNPPFYFSLYTLFRITYLLLMVHYLQTQLLFWQDYEVFHGHLHQLLESVPYSAPHQREGIQPDTLHGCFLILSM